MRTSPSPTNPNAEDAVAEMGRAKRWLVWCTAGFGMLALLLAGLAFVAVQTEWGARLLWQAASRIAPGQLSGDLRGGTLRAGVSLRNIAYRNDAMMVKIDRLDSDWRLLRSPLALHVHFLRIGTAEVTLLASLPTPRALPEKIILPLAIELQNATIRQLVVHQTAGTTRYSDIRFHGSSNKELHTLTLENAVTPIGAATASWQLNGNAPFELSGNAGIDGRYRNERYRINGRFSGSLESLGVRLDIAGAGMLSGEAAIHATPFAAVPFRLAQIDIRHIDPSGFNTEWPQADLAIHASLIPEDDTISDLAQLVVAGPVSIANAKPGPADKNMLPLLWASAAVTLDAGMQRLARMNIILPDNGTLRGNGEIRDGKGHLSLQANRINLQALHTNLRQSTLGGRLVTRLAGDTQYLDLRLTEPAFSVIADAELNPQQIVLHSAKLQAGPAQLDVSGTLERGVQAAYSVSGKLTDFNPALFLASMQQPDAKTRAASRIHNIDARINTGFEAQGILRPELSVNARFTVYDSMYANLPMTGGGTVQLAGTRLLSSDAQLFIAGNKVLLKGSFGAPSDRLQIDVDAPALNRIGFGLSGLLRINGQIGGTLKRPIVNARYRAEKFAFGEHRLARLSGEARTQGVPGATPDAKVKLDLRAREVRSGNINLSTLDANIEGTYANHAIRINSTGRLHGQPLDLTLAAQGRLSEQPQGMTWSGTLRTLENRALPRVSILSPLPISIGPERVDLGASRLRIAQAWIDLKSFRYDASVIRSAGEITNLDIAHLLTLRQQFTGSAPPVITDLVLDGSWNITLASRAEGFVQIVRRRGDIRIIGENLLGLTALSLRADLRGNQIKLNAQANANRIGRIDGQGQVALQRVNGRLGLLPQSPIAARITAAIPRLHTIAALAGPKISLNGSASIDLAVSGTLGNPNITGMISGDALALTLYDQGIRLRDGIARIVLNNNVAQLQRVEFRGGEGTLRATGSIPLDRANPNLTATIIADNLQLLASPAGQLTVSGRATATNVNEQLLVTGKFIVDNARLRLPEATAPALDDDVLVIRSGKPVVTTAQKNAAARPAGKFTPRVNIDIDLGNDFSFKGSGADMQLSGNLKVRSAPGQQPQAFGTVNIVEGTYEAFGTELVIERGVINFQGPLRNPNLNILAMRRQQQVAVGAQVTGSVQQPRVQLVSEPDLPPEEKLSWLVFGRGGGTEPGHAQAAIAGAALGLLNKFGGERIAKGLGLDVLAIGESESGLASTQVVNIGKDLSDRLYIGYEQSLAGAESVVKLIYELTQHWSVVLRGGTVTGMEMLYSKRFDAVRRRR